MMYKTNMFPGKEVSRKTAFETGGFRGKFASKKAGSFIPLNLPTVVQTPLSNGYGLYDAGHDYNDHADNVSPEYILDAVTYDDATAHVMTEDITANDILS